MMTNDSKDQGREAFEVLQVKGVLPLIQAMEKREREGTLPPDLQKAWNGFAIDGAPIATSASALARDEASVELTDDRIIEIAYECDLAPIAPESTCLDFARRILFE